MSETDWISFTEQSSERMAALRKAIPGPARGFSELAQAALAPGVIDARTKELIALAIGISTRCDGCIAFHSRAAKRHGATREEVVETIAVALYMGGGPSMIYGAEALAAFDSLEEGEG